VKVAAYQGPLLPPGSIDAAIELIRERIDWCESHQVDVLCCPEAILGGLADYAPDPAAIAFNVAAGGLDAVVQRLDSPTVSTIVGFTEIDDRGRLFNAAAVCRRGSLAGVYRKLHPAINRSVYDAGTATPVFTLGELTFGIIICRDSTFAEPARLMAAKGAAALFVPTNTGLPPGRADTRIVNEARQCDVQRAVDNGCAVIRADVTGRAGHLTAFGSSGIVDRMGVVLGAVPDADTGIIAAEIDVTNRIASETAVSGG
jgi:predicted amidohydrolase